VVSGAPPPRRPDAGPVLDTPAGPLVLDPPVVVGVLNATPDSFWAGSRHPDPAAAADVARAMVAGGARMLDVGAESTRQGATPVDAAEERRRLLPVLRAVRAAVRVPLSVDTTKAAVAAAALDEGADAVNDVSAGRFDPALLPLCARRGVPVVLMHMKGVPATMAHEPRSTDVVGEVTAFLAERAAAAEAAGVARDAIVLDPGIGFGKQADESLLLLRHLDACVALGYPVLVGPSRKSFMRAVLGERDAGGRLFGTAAAVALAVAAGARLVRVHDAAAMADVVAVAHAIARAGT
jgi:dihydropteroate synthase